MTEFDKKIRTIYISCMAFLAVLILASFVHSIAGHMENLRPEYIRDITIDMMGMSVCGVLIFSISKDKPWDKQNRSLFRLIFILAILLYLDFVSSWLEGNPAMSVATKVVNTLEYINELGIVYCYWAYIREELKLKGSNFDKFNTFSRLIMLLGLVATIINWFGGYFFYISDSGEFVYGNFNWCSEIAALLIYVNVFIMVIKDRNVSVNEKLILLTFQIFPLISTIYSVIVGEYTFLNPAYLLSVLLIYINVFSARSRKILEQNALLNKQSMALMVSQIQPHFLYNTLTTISNLCVTDPEEAEETTILFAQYLRTNLDSLRKTDPVLFKTELGHIKTYVELEKKRFGEKLNVEYDIKESDFSVPALGIQPIVENSIKHGIRGKDTPGHLLISSYKDSRGYVVVIEDDGVGFDPAAPAKEDGRSHVGMINVRSRLEQMCGASMEVESSPGNGCRTTIVFPE